MKQFFIFCSILLMTLTTKAQVGEQGKKRDVQAIIVAFITKKLELTVDEAQKFWPVFNSYAAELRTTAKDADGDIIKRNEARLAIQKKYKPQFQAVLNSEKRANKVFALQDEIIQKLKERRQNRPRGAGRSV